MPKTIACMTRIAGEARLALETDAEGIVREACLVSVLPIRAFESFAKGKNPHFVVEGMKRVCGVCHAVQGITAAMAFEDALGITVPTGGALLREVCGVINRLQSHALSQLLLVDDIFVPREATIIKTKLMELYNDLNDAMEVAGGAPIHSPFITIGGMLKGLSSAAFERLNALTDRMEESLREHAARLGADEIAREEYLSLKAVKIETAPFLACGLFSAAKERIDLNLVEVVPNSFEGAAFAAALGESTGMLALYGGQIVEVGPRARMAIFEGFVGNGLVGLNEARIEEMLVGLERIRAILKMITPEDIVLAEKTTPKAGEGIGLYEAPRGILIHSVRLDSNGRVAQYRIILPTMFNTAVLQKAITGLPAELSATIVRLYDPCMPCEVH